MQITFLKKLFFSFSQFQEENDRLLHYLDPSSEIHLIKTVEKQLISEHLNNILTKGLDALLEEDRKPELKLMYSLVGKFGSNRTNRIQIFLFYKSNFQKMTSVYSKAVQLIVGCTSVINFCLFTLIRLAIHKLKYFALR